MEQRFERPLTIRLTQELNEHVATLAESKQISNASAIRLMLLDHLGLPSEDGLVPAHSRDRWVDALRPLVFGFECLTSQDVDALLNKTREYSLGKHYWRRKRLTQALQQLGFRRQTIHDGHVVRRVFVQRRVKDALQAYFERRAAKIPSRKTKQQLSAGRPGAFSESDVIEIRRLCAEKQLTKRQIATRFGTSSANIYAIQRGNTYKYVGMPVADDEYRRVQAAAIRNFLQRLGRRSEPRQPGDYCSDADVRNIRRMAALGISQVALARHYAVAQQTISRFVHKVRRRDPLEPSYAV